MRSSVFLALMVVVCLAMRCGGQSLSCYTCSTNPSTGADNSQCTSPGSGTSTASNCSWCTMSVTQGTPYSYTRGCSTAPTPPVPINTCTTDSCACNSSLCNSNTFSTLGSLTCYTCSSVYDIDNGCGKVLNPNSIYVNKLSGCTACGLTIAPSGPSGPGVGSYGWARSCLHDIDVHTACSKTATPCFHRCTSNLCNANAAPMPRQAALSTLAASLALVAATLKLA